MSKKVNIYDVAKAAGVSAATVSYVINGKKGKVSKEKAQEILRVMKTLGYVPDHAAISLTTGKSQLLGMCLPLNDVSDAFVANPFYAEFYSNFLEEAKKEGYDVVIGSIRKQADLESWVRARKLDGLVLFGFYSSSVYSMLRKLKIPTVLVDVYDEPSGNFSIVRTNDRKGGYLATDYLIQQGHRNIGFIGGSMKDSILDQKRFEGYEVAMRMHGLQSRPDWIFSTYTSLEGGCEMAVPVSKKIGEITAIVCDADIIAIGLVRKLTELGYSIPKQLSVIGFDDIVPCTYFYPPLTTIRQDIAFKGTKSARVLLDLISGKSEATETVVSEPKVISRASVLKIENENAYKNF
ncbi:MAG: LacI family DNA-binding transcriptional regulator [Candidatus Enteromonas sp.]